MKSPTRILRLALASLCGLSFAATPLSADEAPRTKSGFRLPQPGYEFRFPRDHGSHPDFSIEWWYVTGHLSAGENGDARRFGYQLTFFRLAQQAPQQKSQQTTSANANSGKNSNPESPGEAFRADHLHLAHASFSDLSAQKFYHEERINRQGWDASARVGDLGLRNGNWTLTRKSDGHIELSASIRSDVRLQLELRPSKAAVIFGKDGISRKSSDPSAASYYITFTRLDSAGSLHLDGEELAVHGQSWMDHEISSSQLGPDQVGWDWVSIQLDDGRDVMAYVLRREDGSYDPVSSLSWVGAKGEMTVFEMGEFEWLADGDWTSPNTAARYPIAPRLITEDPATGRRRTFHIRPLMPNQEVDGKLSGMAYWEGACEVVDEAGQVIGQAYLELAGYTPGLRERLRSP